MTQATTRVLLCGTVAVALLSGCTPTGSGPATEAAAPVARAATSTRLVERDVEAPDVFQATDKALWDGRPSLGGVWVASPDAIDPERVIIRNPANGKFVIGALFRRERLNPGPALQISSDAAAALGLLAGQPGTISVIALRREEAPEVAAPDATKPILDSAEQVDTTTLAAAAIDRAERKAPEGPAAPVVAAAPAAAKAPAAAAPASAPAEGVVTAAAEAPAKAKRVPFWKRKKADPAPADASPDAALKAPLDARVETAALPAKGAAPAAAPLPVAASPLPGKPAPTGGGALQIGIFSVEANAKRAVDALAKSGVGARVLTETSQGKTFWRVIADPAGDRAATLDKVKAAGFSDAYFVRG